MVERPIDAAIVNIRTSVPVSLLAIETAITVELDDMFLETCHYTIERQGLSKVFSLRFSGSANLAAGRTHKFVHVKRVGGAWRDLTVNNPAAAEQKLFVDFGKNFKQI